MTLDVAVRPTEGTKARRLLHWAVCKAPGVLLAVVAGLVLIRLTAQDRYVISAIFYYGSPPAVLAGLCAVAGGCWMVSYNRHLRRSAFCGLLCAGFLALWARTSFGSMSTDGEIGAHDVAGGKFRAVQWNVSSGGFGWDHVAGVLREIDADVIVLIEAWIDVATLDRLLRTYFPDYECTAAQGGILILCRGSIGDIRYERLSGGRFKAARCLMDGIAVNVCGVDVFPRLRRPRGEALAELARALQRLDAGPALLMGDFNTPPESAYFGVLRGRWQNAFEAAGAGYVHTWPMPAPVLTLDQVWINGGVRALLCEARWSVYSDHRPVVLEFTVR